MLELFVSKKDNIKQILLVNNGKLVERYEEEKDERRNEGNIFLGKVKDVLKGMEAAFVDIGTEKNSYIHVKDILPKVDEKNNKDLQIKEKIEDIIKINDKLLVQVQKDSNEQKGARISTHIKLPSKYIVLMPNTSIITVSQKITNKKEQERLIKLVKDNLSPNNGAVIRTSANGKTEEIIEDIKNIEKKWNSINETYKKEKSNKPKLIYKTDGIVEKILIDLSCKKLEKVVFDDKEELERIKKYVMQNKEFDNLKLEFSNSDILETYDLKKQIEKSEHRKVWLKCGGFITIDKTEALTAIDVNTGKFTTGKNLSDVIYKVNSEATIEIAKQIRLRDIGGIIIIDYIDMLREGDKEKIENLLKQELKEDRAKTQVEGFTKLDLMELTRKHICSHKG